jgi:TonB family protein
MQIPITNKRLRVVIAGTILAFAVGAVLAAGKVSVHNTQTSASMTRKTAATSVIVMDKTAGATAPEFPGGRKALDRYMDKTVRYPKSVMDNDVTGVVMVSCVVDETGRITEAKLIGWQKVGEGLDEEALRIVKNMPVWKPAMIQGKKVKTSLELPISFMIES